MVFKKNEHAQKLNTLQQSLRPELTVTLGATVAGVALLIWGALPLTAVGLICAFLIGVGWSIHNVALRSAVQMRTPAHLHGRAHAAAGAVVNSFFLAGFEISGLFAASHSEAVFMTAGAITTAVAGLAATALIAGVTAQVTNEDDKAPSAP